MGPFATQILGDMGADVIKIEPFQGDSHRTVGRAHSPDLGLNFLNTGRNKRSLALDLKHAEARNIVDSLVKGADIFISNMRPAALKRLGLDYPSLQSINHGLIHVSLVGFGRDGRYAGLPAYDDLIQAAVGIPWLIQQGSGSEPGYVPLALCDRVVGVAALNPILAALFARSRGASGREIEVPMFETMVRLVLGDHLGRQVYEPAGGPAGYGRLLSRHRRPYRTRDGYIGVLPFDDRHWRKLFRIAGRDELLPKEPITDRTADFDQLYGLLSDIIAENFFQTRDHPSEGPVRMMVVPNGVTPGTDVQISPAPHLGQQSTQILREAGFSDDQIDRFITEKIVRQSSEGDTAAAG
jgi:crotonobetainyl-CoA:carnitine CoA-transferase CaiB-like acyl-CoA transferase